MSDLTFSHETFGMGGERYPDQHLWLLGGPAGVIQFKAGRHRKTSGACESCAKFRDISHFDEHGNCWQAWDLGYHSPRPRYDGHEPQGACRELDGAVCYYDGTSLGASELLDQWLASSCSDEVLVEVMTDRYRGWLESDEETFASPATALFAAIDRMAGDEA